MSEDHLDSFYENQLRLVLQRLDPKEYGYDLRSFYGSIPRGRPFQLTENNRTLLKKFYKHMANQGLAKSRMYLVIGVLGRLLELLGKDFESATKEDFMGTEKEPGLVGKINQMQVGVVTKSDYLKKLKMLDKWQNGGDEPSDRTRKIKTGIGKKHFKLPTQLITPEEAKKIIESTDNPRDRALIHLLWESGCRVGEAINTKIESIQFDKGEARINLHGKVGARQILLLESVRDIKDYLKDRTQSKNSDPLFVTYGSKNKNEVLHHACINKAIRNAANKAAVKKRIYAYLFRHSRASYLASRGLSEAQLCNIFGWEVGSRQVRTYVHLSGSQVESAYKKLYGIQKQEQPEQQIIQCQICGESNPATNTTCQNCYNPITIQGALKIKQENELIKFDRDISQKVFAEALKLMTTQKITAEQAQTQAITTMAQHMKQKENG